ncbi:MAG TPA: type II toxin-antitoxin system Phd/YefM family antitoxin [Opitutales bacterium]|nr:type II toxin-antitoxin system Phd/YefM family antitoxin [Opitutales bacterium]
MTTININEAKTHLSRYAKRVRSGETIILCDRNKPFAEIRPLPQKKKSKKRQLGQLAGKIDFDDGFLEADAEIESDFLKGKVYPESSAQ